MNILDILITIIVVTILVTIVLGVVTYVAYKLRLARRPTARDEPGGTWYFERHEPGESTAAAGAASESARSAVAEEG